MSPILQAILLVGSIALLIAATVCFVAEMTCALADGRAAARDGLPSTPRTYSYLTVMSRCFLIVLWALLYVAHAWRTASWIDSAGYALVCLALGAFAPIVCYKLGHKRELVGM